MQLRFQTEQDLDAFSDFLVLFTGRLAKRLVEEHKLEFTEINLLLHSTLKQLMPDFELQLYAEEDNPAGVHVDTGTRN